MTLTIKILNLFMGAENRIHVILRSYPPFRKERWYAMLRIVGFFCCFIIRLSLEKQLPSPAETNNLPHQVFV